MADPESSFFVVGGTVPPGALSYVTRAADDELLEALAHGEYAYVLNSRQMGKSSLCVRTVGRLREQGVRTLFLDLTKFGARNLTPEQWYAALLSEAGRELGLRPEMLRHWKDHAHLGPMQRFFGALADVALAHDAAPLVAFVDEIDVTRSLSFSADEFFAGIRQGYVARATDPAMSRLTVCLLGTATPAELIQDTRTSPFNIGRRVDLRDFTPEEARALEPAFGPGGAAILRRVLHWTNGHPYLTQRLCREVASQGATTRRAVDRHCDALFLSRTARESDDNLAFVRNRLLKSEVDTAALLELVRKLMARGIPDDEADPLVAVVKMSGIARPEKGRLVIRNRIYARVFDAEWIDNHLPGAELRRQKDAYRRGVRRGLWRTAFLTLALVVTGVYVVYLAADRGVLEGMLDAQNEGIERRPFESFALKEENARLRRRLRDAAIPLEGEYREVEEDNRRMRRQLRKAGLRVESEREANARLAKIADARRKRS